MRPRWLLSGTVARHDVPCPRRHSSWECPSGRRVLRGRCRRGRGGPGEVACRGHGADREAGPIQAQAGQAAKAKVEDTTSVRIATFNVRTSRADRGTSRHWLQAGAARSLARSRAAIPASWPIQELGPGRADGKKGKLNGAIRQTESLLKALKSVGAEQVQTRPDHLVRRKPGTEHGTQGARILYDSDQVPPGHHVPGDHRGKANWNASCSIKLPIMSSRQRESTAARRRTPLFEDRGRASVSTSSSVHLDDRHSGELASESATTGSAASRWRRSSHKMVKPATARTTR